MSQVMHMLIAYVLWVITFHYFLMERFFIMPREKEYWKEWLKKYF